MNKQRAQSLRALFNKVLAKTSTLEELKVEAKALSVPDVDACDSIEELASQIQGEVARELLTEVGLSEERRAELEELLALCTTQRKQFSDQQAAEKAAQVLAGTRYKGR